MSLNPGDRWDGWDLGVELQARLVEVMSVVAVESMGYKEPIVVPRPDRFTPQAARLRLVREAESETGLDPAWSEATQSVVSAIFGGALSPRGGGEG